MTEPAALAVMPATIGLPGWAIGGAEAAGLRTVLGPAADPSQRVAATARLAQLGPVLPLAGGVCPDASWIGARAAEIRRALARLAGRSELVALLPVQPAARPTPTGRAWLQARAAQRAAARASAARLDALPPVWEAAEAATAVVGGAERILLIPTVRAPDIAARLRAALPEIRLVGPFPPYGFAAEALRGA